MFDVIIEGFIEEIMGMCLDNQIESNEIPEIMVKMLLEIGDDGDMEKIFEELTQDCDIDPYGNAVNQLEIYESVYNEITIHLDKEFATITCKYQDAGYSYDEAKQRALNTDYIQHLSAIVRVLDKIIEDIQE